MNDKLTYQNIFDLVIDDLKKVNQTIYEQLNSDVALINQIGQYIINGGGKRIRPIITLLTAKALNYTGDNHIMAAAFIEFIHTATLLHDDVVDESELRRGNPTANTLYGNAASVLVGDYIYTRSFQMMVSIHSIPVLEVMSQATNIIAEGEVQQLMNCNNPDLTEEQYFDVIYRKTAKLFESASHSAALIAEATEAQVMALKDYGRYLGNAFQLIDDLLDYSTNDAKALGKSLGDDLNEGKPTIPLLHAMNTTSNLEDRDLIRKAIEQGNGRLLLDKVLQIMHECGSLEYTYQLAEKQVELALNALNIIPNSVYKSALESLAKLSIIRTH
ncbi:octaprenyl diphosphate synthase [Orbaceae bacterium ac157xtp]